VHSICKTDILYCAVMINYLYLHSCYILRQWRQCNDALFLD
jgi:hypothetical protein